MTHEEREKLWADYWAELSRLSLDALISGVPITEVPWHQASLRALDNAARREVEALLRSIKGVKP